MMLAPLLLASLAARQAEPALPGGIGGNGGFTETLLEPAAGKKPHILFLLIVRRCPALPASCRTLPLRCCLLLSEAQPSLTETG